MKSTSVEGMSAGPERDAKSIVERGGFEHADKPGGVVDLDGLQFSHDGA